MKTGQAGENLIKEFEGLSLTEYLCPAGFWTIGWGHRKGSGEDFKIITIEKAQELLEQDLAEAANCINNLVKVPLTQNQFDALSDFIFNLGAGSFRTSTLLKKLNMKLYNIAAMEFERWDECAGKVSNGLLRRRLAEKSLFMSNAP